MQKPSFRASSLLAAASALASLFAAQSASAADPPMACDPDTYKCVTVDKQVLGKSLANIEFKNGLNSGWLPKCSGGNPDDPCNAVPSGDCPAIAACIQAAMNDSKIDLAMTGDWDVAWPEVNKLQLHPRKKPNGGKFVISYKLEPTFGILINAFNYKNVITIDPFDLLMQLQVMGVQDFNYAATGSCAFDPWAFNPPASCPVSGMPADIFSIPLSTLTGPGIDKYVKIEIGLAAGADATFTYKTTEITANAVGGPGDMPITETNSVISVPFSGGSPYQVNVGGKGVIGYKGMTYMKPTIKVTEIAGIKLGNGLEFPIDVGAELPFEGDIPIDLKKISFDVDLPIVDVPTTTLNFGKVEVGQKSTKMLKVSNAGTLTGTADLTSSNAGVFQAQPATVQIPAGGSQTVNIVFLPKTEGKIEATFTAKTNNPDTPEFKFKVTGEGFINGDTPPDDMPDGMGGAAGSAGKAGSAGQAGSAGKAGSKAALTDNTAGDSTGQSGGCGCRAAGEGPSPSSFGALGLLAGALVIGRRRRGQG